MIMMMVELLECFFNVNLRLTQRLILSFLENSNVGHFFPHLIKDDSDFIYRISIYMLM